MEDWETEKLLKEVERNIVLRTICTGMSHAHSNAQQVLIDRGSVVLEPVIDYLYDSLPTKKFDRSVVLSPGVECFYSSLPTNRFQRIKAWCDFMELLMKKFDPSSEGPKHSTDPMNWIDFCREYLEKQKSI